jgi:6,7-dimethyl-8-ribityllumazine synthase
MSLNEVAGHFDGAGMRVGIVAARFNDYIVERLVVAALDALRRHGVQDAEVTVVRVPGALEIPVATRKLAASGAVDAVVTLGCVIRGETVHFDHVCAETSRGVSLAALDTGVPVTFGVIAAENLEQAIDRAGGKTGNRGWDAAVAAVEMASLLRKLPAAPAAAWKDRAKA